MRRTTRYHGQGGQLLTSEANGFVQVQRCATRRARTVHTTLARARTSSRPRCRAARPASRRGPPLRGSHTSSGMAESPTGSPQMAHVGQGIGRNRTCRSTSSKTVGEPAHWISCGERRSVAQFPRYDRECINTYRYMARQNPSWTRTKAQNNQAPRLHESLTVASDNAGGCRRQNKLHEHRHAGRKGGHTRNRLVVRRMLSFSGAYRLAREFSVSAPSIRWSSCEIVRLAFLALFDASCSARARPSSSASPRYDLFLYP